MKENTILAKASFHEIISELNIMAMTLAEGAIKRKVIAGPMPAPAIIMPAKIGIMAHEQTVKTGASKAAIK